jgi:hypothetical protein
MSALALPGEQQQLRLESRAAILDVVNAYAESVDSRNWALYKRVFSDHH